MRKLEVRLTREPGHERVVGQLAEKDRRVYFEHDPAFLRDPLWLSPFKLPPEPGLVEHRDHDFGPVFGLFDDSLPDGWGLLLMDRFFQQQGTALAEVSVLDRLAYLGTRTMGALTYHPPAEPADRDPRSLDLHDMARASEQGIEGTASEVLPQLLRPGRRCSSGSRETRSSPVRRTSPLPSHIGSSSSGAGRTRPTRDRSSSPTP